MLEKNVVLWYYLIIRKISKEVLPMKDISLRNNNIINSVNSMLTRGGQEIPYNIRIYKNFNNITIDKISRNR